MPTVPVLNENQIAPTPIAAQPRQAADFGAAGENIGNAVTRFGQQASSAVDAKDRIDAIYDDAGAIANPDKTWSQAAGELPEEMASGLLTAGMFGTIAAGAHLVANRLAPAEQAGLQAADQANTIDKLMATAAQSKVRARDPEAFSNLIAGLTKDTPSEHLYVPAEAAASYFQSHDIDYRNDSFWGDYADQIDDGLHTGGDVVIPTSEAAAHLAGTPAWDALKNDTRASPGGASLSEAQAFEADKAGAMEKLGASMADQFQADRDAAAPRDQITDDIRQKLMNAGYRPDQAQLHADLVASRYSTRAERLGQDLTGSETSHIDVNRVLAQPASVMLAASDFGPAHVILVVFATLGESQATEIAQLNFRSGSKTERRHD